MKYNVRKHYVITEKDQTKLNKLVNHFRENESVIFRLAIRSYCQNYFKEHGLD